MNGKIERLPQETFSVAMSSTHLVDKNGRPIHIGSKFIRNGSIETYQVIGLSEDGRIRAQQALLHFGGNPYEHEAPYGSTKALIGPVYLFLHFQIEVNTSWPLN